MIAPGVFRWLCSRGQEAYPGVPKAYQMQRLNTAPHDAVSELLAALRVRSTVYCLSELREPWGFEVDGASVAKFHLVLAGSCWLNLAGHEPVLLQAGDLVILSRGERHMMHDRPGSPVTNLDLIVADH